MLMENGLLQEVGSHQQLLARKGLTMPSIVNKMHQSTNSKLEKSSKIFSALLDL